MKRVYNAVKLDFSVAMSNVRIFAIILCAAILIGVLAKQPVVSVAVAMMLATTLGGTIFSVSEKNNLDKLYGMLPLKKVEKTLARYLYAVIWGLCAVTFMTVIAVFLYPILGFAADKVSLIAALGLSFAYYCFAVGVSYPVYTRLSFSRAYIFTMVPIFLLFIVLFFLAKRTNLLANAGQAFQYFAVHPYLLLLCCVGVGLILLFVSFLITNSLSRKKEL